MKTPRILTSTIAALLLTNATLRAQTWDGGGAAGGVLDWITAANWNPNAAPLNDGTANIIFAGTIDVAGPNLDQNWNINSLTFSNTAGAFVLGSTGAFTLTIQGGGIANTDTQTQTINHTLTLGAAQIWNATNGDLSITGANLTNGGNLLTVTGANDVTINSAIAGTGGLTKSGTGTLTLGGATASTFSGLVSVNAGTLILAKSANTDALAGSIVVGDGLGTDTLQLGANNQTDLASITVNSSGVFNLNNFSETMLVLTITGGSVTTGTGTLNVGSFITMTGGSITSTGAGKLLLNGDVDTLANATAATLNGSVDTGAAVRDLDVAEGAAAIDLDVSAVVSGTGLAKSGAGTLRLSGANTFTSGLTASAGTVAFGSDTAAGTGTLTLNGGTVTADGGARTLANAVNLAADSTVGGTNVINFTGNVTLTGDRALNVTNTSATSLSGAIGGDGAGNTFTKTGAGVLQLSGAASNTYGGGTFVNEGTLQLGKSGGALAIPGNLTIGDGAGTDIVSLLVNQQISDSATVTLAHAGAALNLNTANETIGGLVMTGGAVTSATGTLTLGAGGVTTLASASAAAISGNLNLGGGTRIFDIADGAAATDLNVTALVSNGSLTKTGAGTLRLVANTYTGITTLTAGTLALAGPTALGTSGALLTGGTILAESPLTVGNSLTLGGVITFGGTNNLTLSGPATVNGTSTLAMTNTATTTLSGVLNGPAPFSKQGAGTLVLGGTSTNTFTGAFTVEEGLVVLNKSSGNAVTGFLSIIQNIVAPAVVRLDAANQIGDSVGVAVNGGGTLDLNGFSDTIGALNVTAGSVTTGAGVLTMTGNFSAGTGGTTGTVTGKLNLGAGTRTFTIASSAPAVEVDIAAAISNGGMIKDGTGTLRFSGSVTNAFTLPVVVNAGELRLGKNNGDGSINVPLTIGDGTGLANSDVVRLEVSEQIAANQAVTINNSGLLDLNGFTETLNEIVFAGGNITTGAGALRFDFNFDSVTTNASFRTASISGNLFLDGGSLFITTADGSAAIDMDISATISQGAFNESVQKVGPGLMRLSGSNTFAGGVSLDEGTLAIGNDGALGTSGELFITSGTVRADGGPRTITSIFVNDGGIGTVSGNDNLTLSGILDLPATTSLTKSQSGTLTLQNPIPDWSGALTLANGTLNAGAQTIRTAGVFTQGGAFIGTLTNLGTFNFNGGPFTGQLINQGTANFNANFTASNGISNVTTINLGSGITLSANGTGLVNDGTLTLSNSTLAGSGPLVNSNFLSGFGTIGGTGGFTNNGLISVSGGNLVIANTGANVNAGNIDLPIIRQLRLDTALTNSGTITLASTTINGTATLTNSAGGIVSGRGTIAAPLANNGGTLRAEGGTLTVANAFNNSGVVRAEDGATLIASSITNQTGGLITLLGTLSTSGAVTNSAGGRIDLRNGTGQLGGAGSLANAGLITGDGTIGKSFANNSGGEVRAELGKTLLFSGSPSPNAGTLALQGGTLDFTSALANSATGFITGRGALHTGGLTNDGVLAFSGGTADIFGDTTNAAGARIVTSGAGAVTTFFDDMVHNGLEIFTGANASTVFFGAQSGAGSFTGTGTVYFIGDLRPGNSPALVSYGGDVAFGGTSSLLLEIGGLNPGAEYDHLDVAGTLFADGDLTLALLDGYEPQFGDTFDLLDVGTFAGDFDTISAPALGGGNEWDFSNLKTTGTVTVVPEPGAALLALLGLPVLGLRARRRTGNFSA